MAKKALSAKLDDELLAQASDLAKRLNIPRNRAIEEGLKLWVKKKSKEILARKMQEASLACREVSRENAEEWEATLLDGLDDE